MLDLLNDAVEKDCSGGARVPLEHLVEEQPPCPGHGLREKEQTGDKSCLLCLFCFLTTVSLKGQVGVQVEVAKDIWTCLNCLDNSGCL